MDIIERYNNLKNTASDINEHLGTLYDLVQNDGVQTIIEMGTRNGDSTTALLAGAYMTDKKITCYDLYKSPVVSNFESFDNFNFITADTLKVSIGTADLLFIDTLHTYFQLYNELVRHSNSITTYIALHDTVSFGTIDEKFYSNGSDVKMSDLVQPTYKTGLIKAIEDFLKTEQGKNWYIFKVYTNNNGLTILKRKQHA